MSNDESAGDRKERPDWLKDAEEALDRTRSALREAWEATKEPRSSALESAKQAAKQLGEAIDRGVDVAKGRWRSEAETPSDSSEEE